MSSFFEAIGKYTFHCELAEVHLTALKTAMEGIQMIAERTSKNALSFDPDAALRFLAIAEKAGNYLRVHVDLANQAAELCGRPRLIAGGGDHAEKTT
jgi:hypothetical protein